MKFEFKDRNQELFYEYNQDLTSCEFLLVDYNTKKTRCFYLDLKNPDCENLVKWFNRVLQTKESQLVETKEDN